MGDYEIMMDQIKYNKVLYRSMIKYIYFFLILGMYAIVLNSSGKYEDGMVYFSNALVIVYSLFNVLKDENKAYSARKTFYLFMFFFMGIAPILQYKNGDETVGGYVIYESTYILTNVIIFFILILFDLSYYYYYKRGIFNCLYKKISTDGFERRKEERKLWQLVLLLISVFSFLYTLYYNRNQLYMLVFRGIEGMDVGAVESGDFLSPLYHTFIRPLTVVCCINYWCFGQKRILKYILFLLAFISCFPTSLARLRAAAYYIPMLLILYPALRWKNRYILLFSWGLLLVFPFLNNFRNWGEGYELNLSPDFDMFRSMNFDSYQSFAFVIQNDIITYGQQLLLVFFFWIPRSIWESKPYMSGRMVAHDYNLWFDQISMNYFGEGYLNFGLIGVLIFTIFLGYITSMFDKMFWDYNKGNIKSLFTPFYLFFIGIYFFFMRGDLMYGFQYTIMLLIANYIIFYITKKLL